MATPGGREAMARLAAQLLDSSVMPFTTSPKKSAPAERVATPTIMTPASAPEPSSWPEQPSTTANKQEETPVAPSAATTIGNGPHYTADQLRAARDFMSGATPGSSKSRGGSRKRVLSTAPASTSPSKQRPAPTTSTDRFSSKAAAPVTSQIFSPHADAPQKLPTIKRSDSVLANAPSESKSSAGQAKLSTFDFSSKVATPIALPIHGKENVTPMSNTPASSAGGVGATQKPERWQRKELTNILRTNNVPPHLRGKASVKQELTGVRDASESDMPQANIRSTQVDAPAFDMLQAKARSTEVETGPKGAAPDKGPKDEKPAQVNAEAAIPSPLTANPAQSAANDKHGGSAQQIPEMARGDLLSEIKKEVSLLTKRITSLEEENFALQKQVEVVLQTEERRKFLGTDSAMVPFGVNVRDPSGEVLRVQATATLKTGDLIRRIRSKANLPPATSRDPRVSSKGIQLGHGLTLGEAGVQADDEVLFSFAA